MDLEIGIYGGGVVGLCLAAHFERLNIKYKIIMNKTEYSDGYGLTIQDADNIIHYLGLKPELDKINYLQRYVKIDLDENIISSVNHSKGNYVIPRIELKKMFKSIISDENIIAFDPDIRIKTIEDFEDHVELTLFSNNERYHFKYLIGCDGIHSSVRAHLAMREDTLVDTGYNLKISSFSESSFYKTISNDVIEYVSNDSRLRLFIKPNGPYGASCQITYPSELIEYTQLIPPSILRELNLDSTYTTRLYSSKQINLPTNRVILIGDALHPMVPYNGMGANTAIINAHILSLLLKIDGENLTKQFYDIILDKTFACVNNSYNTFNQIHKYSHISLNKPHIYEYSPMLVFLPNPPNYRLSNRVIEFKNNFTEIILAGVELKTFPLELYNLPHITVLNLNDNFLEEIPSDIKIYTNVKEIYLRNNKLKFIPNELLSLQTLEILRLSYNELEELPEFNTPRLKELCLTGNHLKMIPASIDKCIYLRKIYMSDNNISVIPSLRELIRLQYVRLSNNPILYPAIEDNLTRTQLLNLIELKISITQLDPEMNNIQNRYAFNKIKYGCIYYFNKIVKNVYGCTLSKFERKIFSLGERKIFSLGERKIFSLNPNLNPNLKPNLSNSSNFGNLTNIFTSITRIDARWGIMQTNFIRLNLLKFSTEPFNGFTPKLVKMICSSENINLILRLFTLHITQNISFNQSFLDTLVDYLSRFINRERLLFLITNCRKFLFNLHYELTLIERIYMRNTMTKYENKYEKKYGGTNNHDGYPIHPICGRPRLRHLKCLYENCLEEFTDTRSLSVHLEQNVKQFIWNFHAQHEVFVKSIIDEYYNCVNIIRKCPVECCGYYGDIGEHFRSLGFEPFWKKEDIIDKDTMSPPEKDTMSLPEDYKIICQERCARCNDKGPCVLFECGHKVLCLDCGYKQICEEKNKDCMICLTRTLNIFIC